MSKRVLSTVFGLMMVLSMLLTACAGTTSTAAPTDSSAAPAATSTTGVKPADTEAAPTEAAATQVPQTTRKGGWLDTIVFTSIDKITDAVVQLSAGAIDVYAYGGNDRDAFQATVDDPNLTYSTAYGNTVRAFMFNPAGPTFNDGRLNPFSNRKIREACNWLIDRKYITPEAVGPMGIPQTVVLISAMPDYVRYADLIRPLEAKYAYDFEKAKTAINDAMIEMGAELGSDGKWQYNGAPVVLIGLIRSEDDRTMIGNYFADQLEKVGFTVERQIRTRTELSPIWGQSDPPAGEWSFYTGGWGYNSIARNAGNLFDGYYTNRAGSTTTEQAYVVSDEFDQLSLALANNAFTTMDERREMFAKALEMSLEESTVVWVAQGNRFYPMSNKVQISTDLVAGVDIASLAPYTERFIGQEGGTLRVATSGLLTGAWNALNGQDWVQEVVVQRTTVDDAVFVDPYTGLYWPQRLERAEVVTTTGTPMNKSLDWVDLSFADEIQVPADAWADWDAAKQEFIPVSTKYPDGTTAQTKLTIYYPESLYDVKMHDGSTISVGDFIVNIIQFFDTAKPESPIYDEAQVPAFESFMTYFKGVKVVSTDPLVIETYVDTFDMDAEVLIGANRWGTWFPSQTNNAYSPVFWDTFAVASLAEENRELAFSQDKATALNVTWTHYIDGPSLEILKKYLDLAQAESYIPYATTAGKYITKEEADTRYANLQQFYATYNHFWVGSGPYYLDEVNSVEGSLVVKHFADFPDMADKWSRFSEPMLPVVDASGPSKVTIGEDATFDVLISFKDAAYPSENLENVPFLLYAADGTMVGKGEAELVSEGQYAVKLTSDLTSRLSEGTSQMEIIAVSKVVSVPVFATVTFIVGK